MFDLLKTYFCYEAGYAIGKRLPGAARAIGKGFGLIVSCAVWAGIVDGGLYPYSMGMGIRILTILYGIFVWGGIIGLITLKVMKGKNLFTIYHWVLLGFSLLMGVLAMDEKTIGYVLIGLFLGFFYKQFPEFIYMIADAVVQKILQMKGNK